MSNDPFIQDERAQAISNASYAFAFYLLSFGLLVDIVVRGAIAPQKGNWEDWDLLALVIVSGFAAHAYQWIKRVPVAPRKWVIAYVIVLAIFAALWGLRALL
jgi:hypothetical protein